MSPKSFNNDIGVPLAIFPADPMQDYLVLEIGTNHLGEVKHLSEMASPDIAVITNVGAEHLEGLGDIDGVRREEASIITGLNPKGCLIVNGDDAPLLSLVSQYKGQRITFGLNPSNDLFATEIDCEADGVLFQSEWQRPPERVCADARKAQCLQRAGRDRGRAKMGLAEEAIIESLAHAHGPDMRLQLSHSNGVTILNDAYNANPNSTRAAIETLVSLPSRGRRVAIVGDMLELGAHSDRYHDEIGEMIGQTRLDLLVCVGKNAQRIASSAKAAGLDGARVVVYPDAETAARGFVRRVRSSDLVLLKGSRSIGLEAVAKAITDHHGKFVRRAAS